MVTIASGFKDDEDVGMADITPLTAEQAKELRDANPSTSPWFIVAMQVATGVFVSIAAWLLSGNVSVAWSVGYGALAVIVPAMLFARGLTSQFASINAMTAGFGFFVWEAIKIAVSVGMLFAAPRMVAELNWLALLIGLFLTLKVYWVALLMRPKRKTV
jgi:ATP synthase protein I